MPELWRLAKWILLISLVGVLIGGAVMLVNMQRFASRQLQVAGIPPIDVDPQAIERLRAGLQLETISYQNPARFDVQQFQAFHQFVQESFPRVHQQLERIAPDQIEDDRNLSLVWKWTGREPELDAILLMAHFDVVPVESDTRDAWTHPPFGGVADEQFVWGRGALDVKDGALGLLEAVEHLLSNSFQPRRTIYLSLGHDEEVGGSHGNKSIAQWLRSRGVRLKFVLDEGGCIFEGLPGLNRPVALIGIAEKGYVTLRLVARIEEGGHSSMPPSENVISLLNRALASLETNSFPLRLDGGVGLMLDYVGPEMHWTRKLAIANRWLFAGLIKKQFAATASGNAALRTTMATTMIRGGDKENVLPTRAEAFVNIRILPGDRLQQVSQHVRETVDDPRISVDVLPEARNPSRFSSTESDSFRAVHRTVLEVFPDVLVSPFVLVGTTDSAHFEDISQDVYRFIPARLQERDLARIHGIDERISRENYLEIIRFYIRLIQNAP